MDDSPTRVCCPSGASRADGAGGIYRLTKRGREALALWLTEPTEELEEVRDPATLKLFFGGDPAKLAAAQLAAHRRKLRTYEQLRAEATDWPRGWQLALEAGIGHERESIRFWARIEP